MAFFKLLETIIQERLSDFFEGTLPGLNNTDPIFSDATTGFRPQRSTLDNILAIKELCLDFRENQNRKPLWFAFLDIKKAFDTVNREILWDTVWNAGVRGKMWRMLISLFSGFTGKVRASGLFSPGFLIERGVIQGSRLGPILFNIFFMTLLSKISKLPGAKFSFGLEITILSYADDLILIASSRQRLQHLLNVCFTHSTQNGFQFAPTKCKVLVLHESYANLKQIFLGDTPLEFALGIDFEKRNLNFSSYLNATLNKIQLRSISLGAIGLQKDGLRVLSSRRIYISLVRPLVDYAV